MMSYGKCMRICILHVYLQCAQIFARAPLAILLEKKTISLVVCDDCMCLFDDTHANSIFCLKCKSKKGKG